MADERSNRKVLVHQIEKLQKRITEQDETIRLQADEIARLKSPDKQGKKPSKYDSGRVFGGGTE